ncbi:hypothetical protein [Algoriphagus machipongonensis]|uniref:DUF3278 domain-containing protein n=1 Tax=Algoriphagus machipongonensis TaxID=388413 RepID=A3HZZ6_9BACT|nr:hypothetical protein [Algoriphagus machipongonensis]EAZ80832.1 hypothetical protein ALPR1_07900 [Algoriphagus machipongonensis]
MELEEMKSLWGDLSEKVEKQDKIQKELLMEITGQKFRNKMQGIRIPEIIGSVICYAYAGYFMISFSKFELWYNQVFAIISIIILILLPTASLWTIKGMRAIDIASDVPAELLEKFRTNKKRFWMVQKFGMVLGVFLFMIILSPITELQGRGEIINKPIYWFIYVPVGLIFMFFFTRFVYKKYRAVINKSEALLSDL